MRKLLNEVLKRIEAIEALKYVDIDWGQAETGKPGAGRYPACLVHFIDGRWACQGALIQRGKITIDVSLINLRLSSASSGAGARNPAQRARALEFYALADTVFAQLHGWQPAHYSSRLIRTDSREQQLDGLVIFTQRFTCTVTDLNASPPNERPGVNDFEINAELSDK